MTYVTDCLFCSIASGEIPVDLIHEDNQVVAFRDINPQAPVHVLVIPRDHYANAGELAAADRDTAGALLHAAAKVAHEQGLEDSGFRIVLNTGEGAGQSVFHVHAHVLGGRDLAWPPG